MSFSFVELVLAIVKIAIVIGFCLNMSALATWADRRQSAMIRHRVGPNRAVIYLPRRIIQGILATPGLLIGVGAVFALGRLDARLAYEHLSTAMHLLVATLWVSLLILHWRVVKAGPLNGFESAVGAVRGRVFFLGGLAAHVLIIVSIRTVPLESAVLAARIASAVLGATMATCGFYAAQRVPDDDTGGSRSHGRVYSVLFGPSRVGIRLAGTLHALADSVKMIIKEDFVPPRADKLLHALAPMIAVFPALVVMAVIPFGDAMCFEDTTRTGVFHFVDLLHPVSAMMRDGVSCEGHLVRLQVADLNVGVLYLFAISSTGVIGAAIAGWASDNKFSLLGGLRAASQMVSYEVAMGLSLMGTLLIYGTVRLQPMVGWQSEHAWGIFVQPLGFFLFLAAVLAETKRVPFDQPEGESEIVAGYFLEYSGFKWGMFMAGEYVEVITSSALLVTLFFGGYSLPFLFPDGVTVTLGHSVLFVYKMNHLAVSLIQIVAFFGKVIFFAFIQVFFRWTLPRFRYDQLMKFGWTKLLPLAIANVVVTAVVVVALDQGGPSVADALTTLGTVAQFTVLLGMIAFPVYVASVFMRPRKRTSFLQSSSARFARAAGGVKPTAMQA